MKNVETRRISGLYYYISNSTPGTIVSESTMRSYDPHSKSSNLPLQTI